MLIERALLAVLTLAVTAACGSDDGSAAPPSPDHHGVTVLVMKKTLESGAGVGLPAKPLQLVGDNCVGFKFGTEPTLLAFPPGTKVTGKGHDIVIHVAGGEDLSLGQDFSGGSWFGEGEPASIFDLETEVPAACRDLKVVGFSPE